jgi:hypothetical protein
MVCEVILPRAAAQDQRLHKSALGLNGVVQVVGSPRMEQLAQCYRTQLGLHSCFKMDPFIRRYRQDRLDGVGQFIQRSPPSIE